MRYTTEQSQHRGVDPGRVALIAALAPLSDPTAADHQGINQWLRRATSAILACTPLEDIRRLPKGQLEDASLVIEFGMSTADRNLLARRWGIKGKPDTLTRQILNALHGLALDTGAESPAAVPVGSPPPASDAHQWQPVKGKPGRRKRRLPSGKWHYEDIPMQKAGELHSDYIARLCDRVRELGAA